MILSLFQLLQLFTKLSLSIDLNPQNKFYSQTVEKMFNEAQMDIFEKCFIDKIKPILILRNWTMYSSNTLFQMTLSSKYVMGLKKNDSLQYYKTKEKYYIIEPDNIKVFPVVKFFIEATDLAYLQIALYKLKNSVLWNIYGFFLISNIDAVNSCNSVYSFLNAAWEFSILNVIFMCHNSSHGVSLYTFNPYNPIIPNLWKKFDSYVQENGHPYTIYMIFYKKGKHLSSICNIINYDKTHNLHNYPIKIADMTVNVTVKTAGNHTIIKDFFDIEHDLVRIIWDKLKANITYVKFHGSETGKIDADGISSGVIRKVLTGEYESRSVYDFQRGLWRNEVNLFRKSGRCFILTKEAMSIYEQMAMIFPIELRCILAISFFILTWLLSYWLKNTWADTMIDVLRAAVGAPMIRLQPGTLSTCAIFAWMIITLMVLSSFMQSQLSAMLSVASTKHRNLKNLNDLLDNYEVYGSPYLAASYSETAVRSKIRQNRNGFQCFELMRSDPKIACLLGLRYARYLVQEDDQLHIWVDHTDDDYDIILFRDDSPLKKTFEKLYHRLFQHGFLQKLMNLEIIRYKKYYSEYYKDISLDQLSYAFHFLRVAYVIGSLAFFMELNYNRMSGYVREIKRIIWTMK